MWEDLLRLSSQGRETPALSSVILFPLAPAQGCSPSLPHVLLSFVKGHRFLHLFRSQPSSWTRSELRHRSRLSRSAQPAFHFPGSSAHLCTGPHMPRPAGATDHLWIAVPGSGPHLWGCCGHGPLFIHSVNIYLGEDPWASLTASPVYSLRSLCDLCVNLSSWLFLFPPLFTFCLLLLVPLSGRAPPSLISSFRVFSVLSSPFS